MDLFVIRGGTPLAGRVAVGGSKNAALPMMAASLLVSGPVTLRNVPRLVDVHTLAAVLRSLGSDVEFSETSAELTLAVRDNSACVANYDLVRRMRASVCVLGPLLAARGRAVVSLPGGCNIGDRPIDLHLKGLAALGANLHIDRGYVVATVKQLRGAIIDLAGPHGSTVTGTANVLCAAVRSAGKTVLKNAAREPEIDDLIRFLNTAGANIAGAGSGTLEVVGVDGLNPVSHAVIPDRIEAATLMIAAAMTAGDVVLNDVPTAHLTTVLDRLSAAGATLELQSSPDSRWPALRVRAAGPLRPVDVTAIPYPGFPTDLQAQWTALLTRAAGIGTVTDGVFPDRFLHVAELARLGADIRRDGATVRVTGGPLRGANVMASDLRASAALVLAALVAEGETVVRRIYHLDRGYERLDVKLALLGATIERRRDAAEVAVPPPV